MKKRKIYVVGNSLEYANWMQGKLTNTLEECDLVLFTGGEDVTPSLYNEPAHKTTQNSEFRDTLEQHIFERAKALGKHMIGICRGSQFLCVMAGGKLVQHQQNKYHQHPISLEDGNVINITSTHHQAAFPFNLSDGDYRVIGWGENLSDFHEGFIDGEAVDMATHPNFKECEIVYYPEIKALGIQGHPEYSYQDKESLPYLQTLLTNLLKDTL